VTSEPSLYGRSPAAFPPTRVSVLERLGSSEPEVRRQAFGTLAEGYWKPIYTYVRLKWRLPQADAQDVTQGFLAVAFEKGYFAPFDPAKAKFRTFLRTCLDRFIQNERKAARAAKRGGDVRFVALDFVNAEGEVRAIDPPDPVDPDQLFRDELVRWLFTRSLEQVRTDLLAAGKETQYRVFERYDLETADRPTYAELAAELDLPVTQVTNHLAAARRAFRMRALENLREISVTDEELRADARDLFGVELE
jgi:DNA-directed RNA polymerase specialized sigma24 family protein